MGRAPPHIIFKRAVKHLMGEIIPGSLKEAVEAEEKLNQCWAVNGVGSKKCQAELKRYSEMNQINKKYESFIENKRYKMHALKYLAPAVRKVEVKGRYREKFFINPVTRFKLRGLDLESD